MWLLLKNKFQVACHNATELEFFSFPDSPSICPTRGWDGSSGSYLQSEASSRESFQAMCSFCESSLLCLVIHSCPTPSDPLDCSPPGSFVPADNGILQAKILEWVAISSSRGPFRLRGWTRISCVLQTGSGFFTTDHLGSPCSHHLHLKMAFFRNEKILNALFGENK